MMPGRLSRVSLAAVAAGALAYGSWLVPLPPPDTGGNGGETGTWRDIRSGKPADIKTLASQVASRQGWTGNGGDQGPGKGAQQRSSGDGGDGGDQTQLEKRLQSQVVGIACQGADCVLVVETGNGAAGESTDDQPARWIYRQGDALPSGQRVAAIRPDSVTLVTEGDGGQEQVKVFGPIDASAGEAPSPGDGGNKP